MAGVGADLSRRYIRALIKRNSFGESMKHKLLVLLIAGASVPAVPSYAHHSFAATYVEDKTMTIEGTLVQFLYRNPHSFVHIEAPDERDRCRNGLWSGAP